MTDAKLRKRKRGANKHDNQYILGRLGTFRLTNEVEFISLPCSIRSDNVDSDWIVIATTKESVLNNQ